MARVQAEGCIFSVWLLCFNCSQSAYYVRNVAYNLTAMDRFGSHQAQYLDNHYVLYLYSMINHILVSFRRPHSATADLRFVDCHAVEMELDAALLLSPTSCPVTSPDHFFFSSCCRKSRFFPWKSPNCHTQPTLTFFSQSATC